MEQHPSAQRTLLVYQCIYMCVCYGHAMDPPLEPIRALGLSVGTRDERANPNPFLNPDPDPDPNIIINTTINNNNMIIIVTPEYYFTIVIVIIYYYEWYHHHHHYEVFTTINTKSFGEVNVLC